MKIIGSAGGFAASFDDAFFIVYAVYAYSSQRYCYAHDQGSSVRISDSARVPALGRSSVRRYHRSSVFPSDLTLLPRVSWLHDLHYIDQLVSVQDSFL